MIQKFVSAFRRYAFERGMQNNNLNLYSHTTKHENGLIIVFYKTKELMKPYDMTLYKFLLFLNSKKHCYRFYLRVLMKQSSQITRDLYFKGAKLGI